MSEVDLVALGPVIKELIAPLFENQDSVKSRTTTSPPAAVEGDRYVLPAAPTGAWAGHAYEVARYSGTNWTFSAVTEGTSVWVDDEDKHITFNGSVWQQTSVADLATGTPADVAAAGAVGTSTLVARADHAHGHGALAGGSLHADATTSIAGFMTAADKTKLDGLAANQTAIDATQQAAIDTNTTNVAAIVTRYNEGSDGVRLEKFVAGGILTASNFDAAMRAAEAWCYSSYDGAGWAANTLLIPRGNWNLDSDNGPVVFPGTYGTYGYVAQGRTPGLRCLGGQAACAIWVQGSGLATGRGMIEVGVEGSDYPLSFLMQGITLIANGGAMVGSGIRIRREAYLTSLRDLYVFGFAGVQGPDDGYGIAFDTTPTSWHQHIHIDNVSVQGCQVGMRMSSMGQFTATNLHLNQNLWMSAVLSGSAGAWRGGTMQDGDQVESTTYRNNYWYGGALHPCLAAGFDKIVSSGTGATLYTTTYGTDPDSGIANAGRCVVDGLTGAALGRQHVGLWLYISNGEAYGYGNIVRGMYQISRVLGPESVEILKGTSHALTASLTWEVRGHKGCFVDIVGYIYHEGPKRCMFHIGPVYDATSEQWVIAHQQPQNTIPLIAEGGASSMLDMRNILASGTAHGRVDNWNELRTNHPTVQYGTGGIVVDDFTRRGMEARGQTRRARRFTGYVTEVGGFSWLAKHTSTIDFPTATEVGEWRSGQDAAVKFAPMHAGQYCTYDAADSAFGGPAITIVGGTAGASYKGLVCTIPSAKLPPVNCFITMIAIGRLVSTTVDASGVRTLRATTSDGFLAQQIGVNDGTFFPTGVYAVPWSTTGGNAPSQPAELATATTNPWLIMSGGDYATGYNFDGRVTSWGPKGSGTYATHAYKFYRAAGTDLTIQLPFEYTTTDPFILTGFAILPLMCSPSAVVTLRELIANEWPDKFEI